MSDHDREWIIGCIKHDGFIKTDRFDKANHIILDALEKNIDAEIARLSRPTDLISRADAIEAVADAITEERSVMNCGLDIATKIIKALPSDEVQAKCIAEIKVDAEDIYTRITGLVADKVDVVRCKDCRHRDLFSCPLADNDFQKDEDFCSWGERREE